VPKLGGYRWEMDTNAPRYRCLTCPMCGEPPLLLIPSITPWFCPSDDCAVLCWDPWLSAAANLSGAGDATVLGEPPAAQDTAGDL